MDDTFTSASTIEVNNTSLAIQERGRGDPVVFVHGAVSDLRTWSSQLAAVGVRHRAVAYSCRYARPNDDGGPEADHDLLTHVDDLVALLDALDASPAHLVGHSSGAFVCLLTAIRHPSAVRSLVLAEPPVMTLFVSPQPRARELLRLLARRPRTAFAIMTRGATSLAPAGRAFRRNDDDEGLRHFLRGILASEHFERLSPKRLEPARANVASIKSALVGRGLPRITDDDVRGVTSRTLLVVGERSGAFEHRLIERLEELLPRVETVEIAGASHFSHEDNPQTLNRAVLSFLA